MNLPCGIDSKTKIARISPTPPRVNATGRVLGEVFHELEAVQVGDSGLQRFVAEEARHKTIMSKLIQIRAKNLDQIIRLKCEQSNVKIDSEPTTAPMAGVGA
jgi:hypothetical protein